jgi:lysophospholipase L1-like esterase
VVVFFDKSQPSQETYLYIDGIPTVSQSVAANNNTDAFGSELFHIASRGGSSLYSNQKIQHVAIYSDLSAAKILTHATLAGLTPVVHTVAIADLWDNGYDNVASPRQSPLSKFKFTTTADRLVVKGTTDIANLLGAYAQLNIKINGVVYAYNTFGSNGQKSQNVELGNAGTSRTVEITVGPEGWSTVDGKVEGTYLDSVTFAGNNSITVATPTVGTRLLVYGDSIASGQASQYPAVGSWVSILRNTYSKRVMLEAWGYRSLYDDTHTAPLLAAFVTKLTSFAPSNILLTIGTNDYGLGLQSASDFGTAYAALVDALHAAMPSIGIYMQTPIVRSSEVANGFGSTLGNYRTQINTIHSTRAWTTLIDGTTLVTVDALSDGIHPTDAGHTTYATNIHGLLP